MICIGLLIMFCNAPPPVPQPMCPPLAQYSVADQRRLAAETRRLPRGSMVAQVVADDHTLRQRCRQIGPRR